MSRQPGTPRLLRAINDRSALELLLAHGPLTRPQLGVLTGLSKPTASQLLVRLEERGLVEAVGAQEGGRGPNARLYAVVPSCGYVVGVDARPGGLRAEIADIAGTVVGSASVAAGEAADPVSLVHEAVASATADAGFSTDRLRRVVIGTPGLVDPATGDIRFAWDLPSWHQGLLAALRRDLRASVTFENDVNLAAIAEHHAGAAQDRQDFALIWVGRGLGLAVVLGGRVHRGVSGGAGEIGYLPVPGAAVAHIRPAGKVYPGGFQSLVSAWAVRELAATHGFRAPSAEDALLAARDGGAAGRRLLDDLAGRIALGVTAVCAVVDPGVVVLAGEVGTAGGAPLAERVAEAVAAISPLRPEVRTSAVDGDPVLRGAILSALTTARDEIFGSTT
ncbi:MAG TPA: ROK family transcriptional regulator [Pseudonocardiaceae bacterium]